MNVRKDSLPFGLVLGIALPIVTFIVYYFFMAEPNVGLSQFYDVYVSRNVHTHIISLCAVVNLLLFFAFLRNDSYKSSRGVILATMLYAIWVIIMKYVL